MSAVERRDCVRRAKKKKNPKSMGEVSRDDSSSTSHLPASLKTKATSQLSSGSREKHTVHTFKSLANTVERTDLAFWTPMCWQEYAFIRYATPTIALLSGSGRRLNQLFYSTGRALTSTSKQTRSKQHQLCAGAGSRALECIPFE